MGKPDLGTNHGADIFLGLGAKIRSNSLGHYIATRKRILTAANEEQEGVGDTEIHKYSSS